VPPRFVFAGRLTHDKGWETLLDAAAVLHAEGRTFQLDIAGDGPDADALRQRVEGLALAGHVRLLGRLDAGAVGARFAGALAAIVPSRFQEPAGYVAVEAAAAQVVSVVARVGGLPDTAGPHCPSFPPGSGVDLAAHMARMLDDPAAALVSGRAAYLGACQKFSPSQVANDLMALLR